MKDIHESCIRVHDYRGEIYVWDAGVIIGYEGQYQWLAGTDKRVVFIIQDVTFLWMLLNKMISK